MGQMIRREFLRWIGNGMLGAGLSFAWPFSPLLKGAAQAAEFPSVSVASGTNDDSTETILTTALEGLGGITRFVKPGQTVAIKVNATWAYPPKTASSTDPEMLRILIQMIRAAQAGRIIVIDHCSIDPGTAESLRVSGIGQVVKEEGVESIFPDRMNAPLNTYTEIEFPQGKAFQKLGVIKAALEADVRINLAVAKTHNVTKMSMCLKHMMGFLQAPGLLHANLEEGIADLSTPSPIQAHLHILEALRVRLPYGSYRVCAGPETDETNPNVVRRWNQITAGTDPVLIDLYGTVTYFDMQPDELAYLSKAHAAGLGEIDVLSAQQDGRLCVYKAGAPILRATPTAEPSPTQAVTIDLTHSNPTPPVLETPAILPTSTPLPTATSLPPALADRPLGIQVNAQSSSAVIDAGPFLNVGLISGSHRSCRCRAGCRRAPEPVPRRLKFRGKAGGPC